MLRTPKYPHSYQKMLRLYAKNKVLLNKFTNCKSIIMCYLDTKPKITTHSLHKILDNTVWTCLSQST